MKFTNLFTMMEDMASWVSSHGAQCLCADSPAAGRVGYTGWYIGSSGLEVKRSWEIDLEDLRRSCPELASGIGHGLGGEAQVRVKIASAAENGTLAASLDDHVLSCGSCAAASTHGS